MQRQNLSRRGFLARWSAALTVGACLPAWYARQVLADEQEKEVAARKRLGPNDQIILGAVGVGRQGVSIMKQAMSKPGVKVVAVCDVDSEPSREGRRSRRQRTAPSTPTSASCSPATTSTR